MISLSAMKFVTIFFSALASVNAFSPTSTFTSASISKSMAPDSTLSMAMERSYIMIKPDGAQRGLIGEIVSRFETKGFKLAAMKTKMATKDLVEQHFFPKLRDYMLSGPLVCMVWEGKEVVSTGRKMLGETNPLESAPGTIRGDYCIEVGRNICHGSDSVASAQREIGLWFEDGEVIDWESHPQ